MEGTGGATLTVYDEAALCSSTFKILRGMIHTWMNEVSNHNNFYSCNTFTGDSCVYMCVRVPILYGVQSCTIHVITCQYVVATNHKLAIVCYMHVHA